MTVIYGYNNEETSVENLCEEVGPGWTPLITQLVNDLISLGWNRVVLQVKEKFGGLRFYIGEGTKEIFHKIHYAENLSYTICEKCGAQGKLREELRWLLTLCEDCLAGKLQAMQEQRSWYTTDES